jgi:hydroxypyruvate reductase
MGQEKPKLLVMSRMILTLVTLPEDEFDILYFDAAEDREGWLRANGAGIRAVLAVGTERFDAARLDLLPDLELIAVIAAGYSGVDIEAVKARGIAVTNAGDLNAGDVAEFAVTLMLAHRRDIIANDRWVREDKWPGARQPIGHSVSVQRVGIVGLGHIGLAIARRIEPFGCAIGWWGPRAKPDMPWPRYESLLELADWATTLFIAARGDDSTRKLIDAPILDALGPQGLIVNISRGFVIDEPAMIAALKEKRLGGAALDVFAGEPIAGSHYADVPNLLMTPHVGGATVEALDAVIASALANIRRLFAGEPLQHRVV